MNELLGLQLEARDLSLSQICLRGFEQVRRATVERNGKVSVIPAKQ
jgi:uncharacterized membrane protein YcaP (DUF421 family)